MKPHKHSNVIKAFADGQECLFEGYAHQWYLITSFSDFDIYENVKIKPEPKPDEVRYTAVSLTSADIVSYKQFSTDNLKLTFDGETGKLKSAEVI
jgi:hypothetical protein